LAANWTRKRLSADRLKKLAQRIDALVEKDDQLARQKAEVARLRLEGARALLALCAGFVAEVNSQLTRTRLELAPDRIADDAFEEQRPNLIQINVRGRLLQIELEAPEELISTENFRLPYVLEAAVRAFNQDLLDRNTIEEQFLFACLERDHVVWHYFDARTYQAGLVDQNYLMSLLERVL